MLGADNWQNSGKWQFNARDDSGIYWAPVHTRGHNSTPFTFALIQCVQCSCLCMRERGWTNPAHKHIQATSLADIRQTDTHLHFGTV